MLQKLEEFRDRCQMEAKYPLSKREVVVPEWARAKPSPECRCHSAGMQLSSSEENSFKLEIEKEHCASSDCKAV